MSAQNRCTDGVLESVRDFVHEAVMCIARSQGGTIGAERDRDTHWSAAKLADATAEFATTLYSAPPGRLTIAELAGNAPADRNYANTAFGTPELRRLLPTVATLLLRDRFAEDRAEMLAVKTFECPRQTEAWKSPHHHAPRSVFKFDGDEEKGSTSGRSAYALLLAVTRLSCVIPVCCVPLLSTNWDPEQLERRAWARARREGLADEASSEFVASTLERWETEGLELAGRELPFSVHDIVAELLDDLKLAEATVGCEPLLSGLPAVGGWLAPEDGVLVGSRPPLAGHSLRSLRAHQDRAGETLYDLVCPNSTASASPLVGLPWVLAIGDRELDGPALIAALDREDATVWQQVPPAMTPGEPGDEYWFLARGIAVESDLQMPVTLIAHQRYSGGDADVADASPSGQIRVTTDPCNSGPALGRMLRLSLADSAIHQQGHVDRLRASINALGALDVQPRKLVGENMTGLGLAVAAISIAKGSR